MRNTAALMLVAAIFIGGLTVWLARDFLESRIESTVQEIAPQGVESTTVVVAARPLAFGDTLTRELLKEVPWPSDSLPEGAFTTVNEILDGAERRVALRTMEPNEPLLMSRVSGFGGRATLSQVIGEGMRAATIRVNDVNGVAGFVLPGDRVDIMLTRQRSTGGGASNRGDMITDVILQSVRVLAVDQLASENAEDPFVPKVVTFEVTIQDAQKLSLAASVGTLTLSLRNFISTEDENGKIKTISVKDLTPGTPPSQKNDKVVRQVSSTSKIRVTRGMSSKTQTVQRDR